MKQKNCTGHLNVKDEYYTPAILTDAIAQYVPEGSSVWCPFDTRGSEFVHSLMARQCCVEYSHIRHGSDFFDRRVPMSLDFIISNPPFSKKMRVLRRLFDIGIPFAMLLPTPCLNYCEVAGLFVEHPVQLLIFDKKVSFDGNTASFSTSFFCHKMLPHDLIFEHLPHNNTGKNFTKSRMWLDF